LALNLPLLPHEQKRKDPALSFSGYQLYAYT
jgi:hypothetical protein